MPRIALALILVSSLSCSNGEDLHRLEADLTLRAISIEASRVPDGPIRVIARNLDEGRHELLILRTDRAPDDLPVRASRVATRVEDIATVARVEPFDGPATRSTTVELAPGPYVLICNLAGHYMLGMRTGLQINAG